MGKGTDKSIDEMMSELFTAWDYIEVGRFNKDCPWFCRNGTDEGLSSSEKEVGATGKTPTEAVEKAYKKVFKGVK